MRRALDYFVAILLLTVVLLPVYRAVDDSLSGVWSWVVCFLITLPFVVMVEWAFHRKSPEVSEESE